MAVSSQTEGVAFELGGFQWDDGNRKKCRKHGVTQLEIEQLFLGAVAVFPDPIHSQSEERFIAVGRTAKGRAVLVVFTLRRSAVGILVRPISARFMHQAEIEHYEEETADAQKR